MKRANASQAHDGRRGGKVHLLIVDDDRRLLEVLGAYLRTKGHDILLADNGTKALCLARAHHPDVVISDWNLGAEPDGLAVAQALKDEDAGVYVALISGRRGLEEAASHLDVPCLRKPVSPEQLLRLLTSADALRSA